MEKSQQIPSKTIESIETLQEQLAAVSLIKEQAEGQHSDSDGSESESSAYVDSETPSEFNDVDHLFHIDFMRSMRSLLCQPQKR